jgi:uracil phosphoribosyltransferase
MPRRELTQNEAIALRDYLDISDTQQLAVALHANGLEYIVKDPAEEAIETGNGDDVLPHLIICQLLWLTRLDQQVHNHLEGTFSSEEIVFPESIHVLADYDIFAANHLTKMRDKTTDRRGYRHHSNNLSRRLLEVATQDLGGRMEMITTGTGIKMLAPRLNERVVIVPILRAGLSFYSVAEELLPESTIAVEGLRRDEEDPESKAHAYYTSLAKSHIDENTVVVVTDPMLATGGSMDLVVENVLKFSPKEVRIVCHIAAPEGIARLQAKYPHIKIWCGAVDSHLNEKNYIIPGLGDAGDRQFGTEG